MRAECTRHTKMESYCIRPNGFHAVTICAVLLTLPAVMSSTVTSSISSPLQSSSEMSSIATNKMNFTSMLSLTSSMTSSMTSYMASSVMSSGFPERGALYATSNGSPKSTPSYQSSASSLPLANRKSFSSSSMTSSSYSSGALVMSSITSSVKTSSSSVSKKIHFHPETLEGKVVICVLLGIAGIGLILLATRVFMAISDATTSKR